MYIVVKLDGKGTADVFCRDIKTMDEAIALIKACTNKDSADVTYYVCEVQA